MTFKDGLPVEAQDWMAVAQRLAQEKAVSEAARERLVRRVMELETELSVLKEERREHTASTD